MTNKSHITLKHKDTFAAIIEFNKNKLSLIERFKQKIIEREGHWLWKSSIDNKRPQGVLGFYIPFLKRNMQATQFSYHFYKGGIEDGYQITTTCGISYCVNPEHLNQISVKEKIKRKVEKQPIKNCDKCNVPLVKRTPTSSQRTCLKCSSENSRKWAKENPDKTRTYEKKYWTNNPGKLKAKKIRNALKRKEKKKLIRGNVLAE